MADNVVSKNPGFLTPPELCDVIQDNLELNIALTMLTQWKADDVPRNQLNLQLGVIGTADVPTDRRMQGKYNGSCYGILFN